MTKLGDVLWTCDEDDSGKVSFTEYRVRTIRKGKAYATAIYPWTWGKLSSKSGDFGWLDPIPSWCRRAWRIGENLPYGLRTTKLAAIKEAIRIHKEHGDPDDYADPATYDRITKTLASMLTRERNKKAKK